MNINLIKCYLALSLILLLLGCENTELQSRLDSIIVEVEGNEFHWTFRYPGVDGVLGNDDDQYSQQNLFLPDHSEITLKLVSKDYVYSFALPDLGLKEIAVPDLEFNLNFNTKSEQTLLLLGDQFCGYSHKTLIGKVYVRNQNNGFYGW